MRNHGFTAMEFMLVVAITGVLLLGVGVLIEVPRRVVENSQNDAAISSTLLSIDQLEKDVKFAADVVLSDPLRLQIHPKGAPMIEYAWDGVVGGALTRTDTNGSVTMMTNVHALTFGVEMVTVQGEIEDGDVVSTAVEVASWSTFALDGAYSFGTGGGKAVSVTAETVDVSIAEAAGYFFVAQGLGGDTALPAQLTARLARQGTADLFVNVYSAHPTTRVPNILDHYATAWIQNAALPATLTDHTIPLTGLKRVQEGSSYIAVLSPIGFGITTCRIEHHILSKPKAAADATTAFMQGNLLSWWQASGSQDPDASQAPFVFQATLDDVGGVGVPTTYEVPINVTLDVALVGVDGTNHLETTFTLQNNLCLTNQ